MFKWLNVLKKKEPPTISKEELLYNQIIERLKTFERYRESNFSNYIRGLLHVPYEPLKNMSKSHTKSDFLNHLVSMYKRGDDKNRTLLDNMFSSTPFTSCADFGSLDSTIASYDYSVQDISVKNVDWHLFLEMVEL